MLISSSLSFLEDLAMAAQFIRSHRSQPQLQRYTLVLCNGDLLRHQDPLAVAQFRSDARLIDVKPEPMSVPVLLASPHLVKQADGAVSSERLAG